MSQSPMLARDGHFSFFNRLVDIEYPKITIDTKPAQIIDRLNTYSKLKIKVLDGLWLVIFHVEKQKVDEICIHFWEIDICPFNTQNR